MHKDQSRIAIIELNAHSCWEILFKPNSVLSLEDVAGVYEYIHTEAVINPLLMDWSMIQGVEFEALEYIANTQKPEHPLVIVSESGSIGEKYGHLIDQLSAQNCTHITFSTMQEARNWVTHFMHKET